MAKPLPTQAGAPNQKVCAWGFGSHSPAELPEPSGEDQLQGPGADLHSWADAIESAAPWRCALGAQPRRREHAGLANRGCRSAALTAMAHTSSDPGQLHEGALHMAQQGFRLDRAEYG